MALESTGVYWKPIINILEADFELVVNAKHINNVPGPKTDLAGLPLGSWSMPTSSRPRPRPS